MSPMISTWHLRTAVELAKLVAGRVALAPPSQPNYDVVDIGFIPIPKGSWKAHPTDNDPSKLPFIVVHCTGIATGFGARRSSIPVWQRLLDDPTYQPPELRYLRNRTDLARNLAVWERLRETPYHRIGCQSGHVIRNRPLRQRSYHGGPVGNDGAGFAMDCSPTTTFTSDFARTCKAALWDLAREMIAAGCSTPIRVFPHRCVEAPNRRGNDPGAEPWRTVVMPAVDEHRDVLEIDYEMRANRGLPIPRTWDPNALYDAKGRRLA